MFTYFLVYFLPFLPLPLSEGSASRGNLFCSLLHKLSEQYCAPARGPINMDGTNRMNDSVTTAGKTTWGWGGCLILRWEKHMQAQVTQDTQIWVSVLVLIRVSTHFFSSMKPTKGEGF